MQNFVLEMKFPNGNIIRKHYSAVLLSTAVGMAKAEYPEALEYKFLYSWEPMKENE